jgi:hypothetical protein
VNYTVWGGVVCSRKRDVGSGYTLFQSLFGANFTTAPCRLSFVPFFFSTLVVVPPFLLPFFSSCCLYFSVFFLPSVSYPSSIPMLCFYFYICFLSSVFVPFDCYIYTFAAWSCFVFETLCLLPLNGNAKIISKIPSPCTVV